MKKLILGVALAIAAASPMFAQSAYAQHRSTVSRLDGIRAQAMPAMNGNTVYSYGQYAGADPDPNVRLQLRQNYESILDR